MENDNSVKTTYIYTISDEKGCIRYIGKSNNPGRRIHQHINEQHNKHKYNWLRSIINRGYFPKIEILEEVPESDWQAFEKYWISQFKVWGFKLLNVTDGGEGADGYKHRKLSKKKMRHSKLGVPLSKEHRENISKGVKEKAKEFPNYNRSGGNIGVPLDRDMLYDLYITQDLTMPKTAEYMNTSETTVFRNLKKYNIEKSKEALSNQYSTQPIKVVLQYDLGGNLVKEWSGGPVEVRRETGIEVARCCRGIMKTSKGYIWRYRDEWFDIGLDKLGNGERSVQQYDMLGNFIGEFSSIKEAGELIGVSCNSISNCCSGNLRSYKNYQWIYKGDEPPKKYTNKLIRPVIQLDVFGNILNEYTSMAEASKATGIGSNNIQMCCVGKSKTSGGFIWSYK